MLYLPIVIAIPSNLAANDSIKKSKFMKGSLETTSEITKLIKLSPRRDAIFEELKSDHDLMTGSKSRAICLLCPDSMHPIELQSVIGFLG